MPNTLKFATMSTSGSSSHWTCSPSMTAMEIVAKASAWSSVSGVADDFAMLRRSALRTLT